MSISQGFSKDFLLKVSAKKVAGHSMIFTNGYSDLVGTTESLVWSLGGNFTFVDTGSDLYVSSSESTDVGLNVLVDYLDDNYVTVVKIVTLNGQTPVSVGSGVRVNNIQAYGMAPTTGDVYVANALTHTSGVPTQASTIAMFKKEDQISSAGMYTVPAGHTWFGVGLYMSAGKGKDVVFASVVRNPSRPYPALRTNKLSLYETTQYMDMGYTTVSEKTDLYFTATSSNTNTTASMRVTGILINNSY